MLITAALALAGGYLALCVALFFAQRSLLFQPPAQVNTPSAQQGALLRIPGPAGAPVVIATWLAPKEPGGGTAVMFHGNAEQLSDLESRTVVLHSIGLGVLCVEYPGYGLAPGAPSRDSLLAAGSAALAHLRGPLGVPARNTVLVAHSLGTGVAAELAARGEAGRQILLSPFTSIRELAARVAPWAPVSLLLRDRFDTAALAPALKLPTLIVHGSNDEVIPSSMGRRLSEQIAGARLIWVEGGMHNDLFVAHGREVWPEVLGFAFAAGRDGSAAATPGKN